MKVKVFVLASVFAIVTAGCGGGGGDNDGIQLENPDVSVTGITSGETVTVTLNGGSAQQTISSDGTYRYGTKIDQGDTYSLSVVSTSGITCLFANSSDSISGVKAGGKPPVLDCLGGSGGGGGTGTVSQIEPPFKLYGWTGRILSGAKMVSPISILDGDDNPLTGATLSDFTFYEDDQEIVSSPEYPIHVQPMPAGNMKLNIAIALDISESLSESELAKLKNALKLFVANQDSGTRFSLYTFDSTVNTPVSNELEQSVVQNANDSIDTSLQSRDASTDVYGAITEAANNLDYNAYVAGTLGYVVVVTDGLHTANTEDASSTSDAVEHTLVYGVGVGDGYDPQELQTAIGEPEGAGQTLFQASAADEVSGVMNDIDNRVSNLISGLHMLYYRSPRRDDAEHEFRAEATPLSECAAVTSANEACGFFWNYDSTGMNKLNALFIVPSAIRPSPGQTVTYRVPDWSFCSPTPDYQWSLTMNQGTATETIIDGGQALEVAYGSATPISADITVTDSISGCSYSVTTSGP